MKIWAILPAAGIGRRMGSSTPKQYLTVCGTPVLLHSINRLLEIPEIEHLVVALHPEDEYWENLGFYSERVSSITGGEERFNSVLNALNALDGKAQADDWVLVHDAVRPCVSKADIRNLIDQLGHGEVGGLLATPVNNTVKQAGADRQVIRTLDRSDLWAALTPQMFRYQLLRDALARAVEAGLEVTDEASAIEALGLAPELVTGSSSNIKITREEDLKLAEFILTTGDFADE
ncbi:MAG: 2-C-methyl-D-erythritol 4-phosphate cytidylyltransferase [Gammaproteobacteria bacterium]|nr:2-C-methyl-D-erythritol 4-phosphate cytidylyltransferase [Gammaproteobacteria bacterium]MDD9957747.1 2-C-methyl-D-erythritol 4-phosphate cytidylyltransferase [Gammaproteobacteria bacterium]